MAVKLDVHNNYSIIPDRFLLDPIIASDIPKNIMQTWKTKDVPDHWKSSPASISKYMRNWSYFLSDDESNRNLVATYFPDFLSTYDNFPYNIQRADAVRYVWLYLFGGLYMDLDIKLKGSLESLFNDKNGLYLVKSGNIGSVITNSIMASKAGHPIWLEMIEEMKKPLPIWCVGKHLIVMNSTGPMALDRVVKRSNYKYSILPISAMGTCSVCEEKCSTPGALIEPLQGSSWVEADTVFYNFWLCNWRMVVGGILIALVLLLIIYVLFF